MPAKDMAKYMRGYRKRQSDKLALTKLRSNHVKQRTQTATTKFDETNYEACVDHFRSFGVAKDAAEEYCRKCSTFRQVAGDIESEADGLGVSITVRDATPMERCVGLRIDVHGESPEQAEANCQKILYGPLVTEYFTSGSSELVAETMHEWDKEHGYVESSTEELIQRSRELLNLHKQREIKRDEARQKGLQPDQRPEKDREEWNRKAYVVLKSGQLALEGKKLKLETDRDAIVKLVTETKKLLEKYPDPELEREFAKRRRTRSDIYGRERQKMLDAIKRGEEKENDR